MNSFIRLATNLNFFYNFLVSSKDLQKAGQLARIFDEDSSKTNGKLCLSSITFGIILGVLVIVLVASLIAITIFCLRKSSTPIVKG